MAMAEPRKLRGHKATATCCISSRDWPGLAVTSGESLSLRLLDGCVFWFDLRCNEDVLYASHGNEIKSFDVHTLSAGSWKPLESYGYNKDEVNQVEKLKNNYFLKLVLQAYPFSHCFVLLASVKKTKLKSHLKCITYKDMQFIPWRPWEVITGGLDSKLVLCDFSKGRPQKIIDFSSDTHSSSGQCLNPAFVHSIAVPEMDMVDKLGKICAVARGDGIVGLITIAQERE
ncbi:hypothetical protein Bca4012_083445 [Brassica carinata]|uniref:Uncharacterized protein n=1 Tax=Brassica carinata TaxID=52824 RepID=A0A8X7VAG1_BRACI|nr:hypothetical protein Bca52824_027284 [Brassica carinata]